MRTNFRVGQHSLTCMIALSSLASSILALAAWPRASFFPCSAANLVAAAWAALCLISVISSACFPALSSLFASLPFLGIISPPLSPLSTTTKSAQGGVGIVFQALAPGVGSVHEVVFHMGVAVKVWSL